MISVILLLAVEMGVVQYGANNRIGIAYNELYEEEDTKDEEKNIEMDYEEEEKAKNDYELVKEQTVVASAERSREVSTRQASSRNNNASSSLPIEKPIVEQSQEKPQEQSQEKPQEEPREEPAEQPQSTYIDARAMLRLINAERANHGLEPLAWSNSLTESARIRAREITVLFSHTRPDGRPWNTVGASINGENIAARQITIEIAFRAWMESPSHRENILRPDFRTIGIAGLHNPNTEHGYYWVQLFRR